MALNKKEQDELSRVIPITTRVVASGLVQLFFASPDSNPANNDPVVAMLKEQKKADWMYQEVYGALLLEKDNKDCLFFTIYDVYKFKKRYSFELYYNLDYIKLGNKFHAFEAEGYVCGFSFMEEAVAKKFFDRVKSNIPSQGAAAVPVKIPTNLKTKSTGNSENDEILLPSGLLNPDAIPREWKRIFRTVGIKKKELKNPKMLDVIYEVLSNHGISVSEYIAGSSQKSSGQSGDMSPRMKEEEILYQQQLAEYERQQAMQLKLEETKKQREFQTAELKRQHELPKQERQSVKAQREHEQEMQKQLEEAARKQKELEQQLKSQKKAPAPAPPARRQKKKDRGPPPSLPRRVAKEIEAPPPPPVQKVVPVPVPKKETKPKPSFLKNIEDKAAVLKHVTLDKSKQEKVPEAKPDSLFGTLIDRVNQQRKNLGIEEEDDGNDSDFSFED